MLDTSKVLQQSVTRLLDTRQDISRLDLSRLMNVSDGALGRIKYGNGNPTAETIERIANFFRVEPWQLLVPGFDPSNPPALLGATERVLAASGDVPAGYVRLDQLDVQGSAGPGAHPPSLPAVVQQIDVLESWARDTFGTARPDRIKIISCRGDSMSPTIHDGEIVFVDINVEGFDRDGIYVILWGGQLRIKRLVATRDGVTVKSDNPHVDPEHIPNKELHELTICGRVMAWWRLQRY